MDSLDETSGLQLTVELAGPAVACRAAILAVKLANRGNGPQLVSRRLNLFEGDLRLRCRDPSGEERRIDGWQIDTLPAGIELPAGRALVGAVNLLEGGDGPIFREPGRHEVAAEYLPAADRPWILSSATAAEVAAPPPGAEEAALDAALADRWLRRALVKADAREAPEAIERLAADFPERLEGELARLIVAGSGDPAGQLDWPTLLARDGVRTLAIRLLALQTPYSTAGTRLAEAFAAALERPLPDGEDRELARRMVRGEPIPA